ncbi:hypothetical protein Vadar_025414 [Vaccinium darrowii]|uniref:Uncharacterized protein n=1 Tax=Vaccinium darrowii TaxID=229202 RepID=A0ACB7Y954_9ERIC|nr:hypothetical protein Vadar_025414 [Vaccinium darrowii]
MGRFEEMRGNLGRVGDLKIADPALDCIQKLISHEYLRGALDEANILSKLVESICKCSKLADEAIELSKNVVNQTTAKARLIQMLVIVFRRTESNSSTMPVQPIVVAELMEPSEKGEDNSNMMMFVQSPWIWWICWIPWIRICWILGCKVLGD